MLQQSIDSLHRRLNETSTAAAKHLDNLSNNTIRQRAKSRVSLNLSGTINPVRSWELQGVLQTQYSFIFAFLKISNLFPYSLYFTGYSRIR